MGEFHSWESYEKCVDQYQQIVSQYLFQKMFIVRSMNPYQKSIFVHSKIPEQKSVSDAPLLARQVFGNVVSHFNALEGPT